MQALSESELMIMQWIWRTSEPVTTAGVMGAYASRGWKSQTVGTFLTRLADKGFLSVQRVGAQNHYTPLILETDYRARQTKEFLEQMHGGSVRSMIAALCDADSLRDGELEELRRWLEKE